MQLNWIFRDILLPFTMAFFCTWKGSNFKQSLQRIIIFVLLFFSFKWWWCTVLGHLLVDCNKRVKRHCFYFRLVTIQTGPFFLSTLTCISFLIKNLSILYVFVFKFYKHNAKWIEERDFFILSIYCEQIYIQDRKSVV